MIDDKYINNFAKNWVSAVFHSRVIRRSVLSRFIELCIETPCRCPLEHVGAPWSMKRSCRKVTETSVVESSY